MYTFTSSEYTSHVESLFSSSKTNINLLGKPAYSANLLVVFLLYLAVSSEIEILDVVIRVESQYLALRYSLGSSLYVYSNPMFGLADTSNICALTSGLDAATGGRELPDQVLSSYSDQKKKSSLGIPVKCFVYLGLDLGDEQSKTGC